MHIVTFLGVFLIFALAVVVIGTHLMADGDRMIAALLGQEFRMEAAPRISDVNRTEKHENSVNLYSFPPVFVKGLRAQDQPEALPLAA